MIFCRNFVQSMCHLTQVKSMRARGVHSEQILIAVIDVIDNTL